MWFIKKENLDSVLNIREFSIFFSFMVDFIEFFFYRVFIK